MLPHDSASSPRRERLTAGFSSTVQTVAPGGQSAKRRPVRPAVDPFVRWAFYGFVFSIPFEYPPRTIPFEVHTITGSFFLLTALLQPQICFRRTPKALWWFAAFISFYAGLGLLVSNHLVDAIEFSLNLLQAMFLFWTCYNLMRYESLAKTAFLVFVFACATLVLLQVSGLGATYHVSTTEGTRISVLGQDPNILSGNMALGIVLLIGLAYGIHVKALRYRFIVWPLIGLLVLGILLTGSRGAVIVVGTGILVFALNRGNIRTVLRNLVVVSLAMGFVVWASFNSPTTKTRYEKSLKGGNMAGRELIYPIAWQMFREKPLFGWGPINQEYELGKRTKKYEFGDPTKKNRETRAVHNMVLQILTETGITGAILLFFCIGLCVQAGWRARKGTQGILPLAAAIAMIMVNMFIPWIAAKQVWLVLAYALACGDQVTSKQMRHAATTSEIAMARLSTETRRKRPKRIPRRA